MRLTCPNCGAQYEVPDDVIPAEGRDVQCSDCGTTWFQDGPFSEAPDSTGPVAAPSFDPPEPEGEQQEDFATAPDPTGDSQGDAPPVTPSFGTEDTSAEDWSEDDDEIEEDYTEAPAPQMEHPRRKLEPSVTDILREEAERESALRAAEASGLETQPDLGLEQPSSGDTERRAEQTRERMARLRGEDPNAVEEEFTGSRRGLLPDIEEINSSLRGGYEVPAAADALQYDETVGRQRSSFLRGFTIAILLTIAAALIYQNADPISTRLPGAAPALETFVDWVNASRVWLHTQVEQLAKDPAQ